MTNFRVVALALYKDNSELWTTNLTQWKVWLLVFIKFIPQEKWLKWCSSTKTLGYTQVVDNTATTILQSWPYTLTLSPAWCFEKKPTRTPFCWYGDPTKCCVPSAAEEREQLLLCGNTCSCSKVEEGCWQWWTTLKNDYAQSNAVMKICVIFECPTCK